MLQRALIALVLALKPALIVADEPTTNLDAIVGRQVIPLFREVQQRLRASFLYITHDLGSARTFCNRIAVMYAGQVVEQGAAASMLERPRHPYSQGLLAAATELAQRPQADGSSVRCVLHDAACSAAARGRRPPGDVPAWRLPGTVAASSAEPGSRRDEPRAAQGRDAGYSACLSSARQSR